jgi:hypothetical protein
MKWKKTWKEVVVAYFEELFRNLPVLPIGTEEKHEKSQSVLLVSGPRFEPVPPEYKAGGQQCSVRRPT